MHNFSAGRDSRLYLFGPMTGFPKENRPAFFAAATRLRAMGFEVLNPPELDTLAPLEGAGHARWAFAMKRDIPWLLKCNLALGLPGWRTSKGSVLEATIMSELRTPVWEYAGPKGTFDPDRIQIVPPDQLPSPTFLR